MEEKNIFTEVETLLNRLKANEESIGKDVLMKKHPKKYKALRDDICKQLTIILTEFAYSGLHFFPEDVNSKEQAMKRFKKIVAEEQEMIKSLKEIAFATYSYDAFLEAACPLVTRIRYEGYGPYWLENCKYYNDDPKYHWYNRIIEMWYDEELKMWVSTNAEGHPCVAIYYPPTQELFDKAYEEEKKSYEEWKEKEKAS